MGVRIDVCERKKKENNNPSQSVILFAYYTNYFSILLIWIKSKRKKTN
jgi:hypothetical protein